MVLLIRLLLIVFCMIMGLTKGFCAPDSTKSNEFEIGPDIFFQQYRAVKFDSKSRAMFEGGFIEDTFRPFNTQSWWINVFHVDVSGNYGNANYKAEDIKIHNIDNCRLEPRVWVGKDINLSPNLLLTPYTGFGYRWLFKRLKNQDEGRGNEQTQYFYLPFGANLTLYPSEGWRLVFNAEYDLMFWGKETDFTPDASSWKTFDNTLGRGSGARGGIKFVKVENGFNIFIEPYFRYWYIPKSKAVDVLVTGEGLLTLYVPANRTVETGVRFGVEF
ncbi:MAG: hypothetical protein HQL13_01675 [Candidatus Omnitrophica bacterium]|nr:hypothetical protein [Candidatus Omnitrophota bacterium]